MNATEEAWRMLVYAGNELLGNDEYLTDNIFCALAEIVDAISDALDNNGNISIISEESN